MADIVLDVFFESIKRPRMRRSIRYMLPLLMPHLHDARVRDALVDRLAQDPPWRHAFLAGLREETTPAADAETLLAALARRMTVVKGFLGRNAY